MLFYAERSLNIFYIQGVTEGPVTDFFVESNGPLINVGRYSTGHYEVLDLPFGQVESDSGQIFDTPEDTVAYLNSLTVPSFPMRFTVSYPLAIDSDRPNVRLEKAFIEQRIDLIDGQNF